MFCIPCLFMDRLKINSVGCLISLNNTSVLLSKFNNQLTEKAVAACNIKHAQYK